MGVWETVAILQSGNAISVTFACLSAVSAGTVEHESLHTRFAYQPRSDTWRLTIDDVKDGKTDRFGDMKLTRTPPQ